MAAPRFELHIRPLFRALDREHMRSMFDLWRYEDVASHVDSILSRVAVDMPTLATGGPWPEEWVTLLRRWRDEGLKRLELGTATYSLSRVGARIVLTAQGVYPRGGYRGWLELEEGNSTERRYTLYFDAPDAADGNPGQPFTFRERYPATDARKVVVRDSAGDHEVKEVAPAPSLELLDAMTDMQFFRETRD
jgi:hypothetical protein